MVAHFCHLMTTSQNYRINFLRQEPEISSFLLAFFLSPFIYHIIIVNIMCNTVLGSRNTNNFHQDLTKLYNLVLYWMWAGSHERQETTRMIPGSLASDTQ